MTAVFLLRFVEYAGAALLFGAPLFLLYSQVLLGVVPVK